MLPKKLDAEDKVMLKEWARVLPVVMEWTSKKHKMTGEEMKEMGFVEEMGGEVDSEGKYVYSMPVQMAANHYRRLKRAWLKDGQPGLTKYLKHIVQLIEKEKQDA